MAAGYLVESNVYAPAISKVDTQNDEANLQLANRTRYLNNAINNLSNYLSTVKDTTDLQIEELSDRINKIKAVIRDDTSSSIETSDDLIIAVNKLLKDVSNIENLLQTHTHNYAGSSKAGGPASEVAISDDSINRLSILGTDSIHLNQVKRNPQVFIEENDIYADNFHGNLSGTASSAESLSNSPDINLIGEVQGTANFTGNKDVNIITTLQEQNVAPGEYGETSNYTLELNGSILIPSITVNSRGIITRIQNRVVQLPNNLGTNNAISATQDERKIYLVGASSQDKYASTYSQNGVYAKDNVLYSNNDQVVTLDSDQNLTNKTINGYIPNEAMEYTVDSTIGGTIDSNSLITSNALARHTHNYASSKKPSGDAETVEINDTVNDKIYNVTLNKDNKLHKTNIVVHNDALISNTLKAINNMYIPGGKIWLENDESSDDSGGNLFPGDFLNPEDYVRRVYNQKLHPSEDEVKSGTLLSYKKDGYVLADNSFPNTSKNLALALTDSKNKILDVMTFGVVNIGENLFDGIDVYVGKTGQIVYGRPSDDNIVIRKIGYIRENYLIFYPNADEATSERLDYLDRILHQLYSDKNNYVWMLEETRNLTIIDEPHFDNMWEFDEEGDVTPTLFSVPNNFWEIYDYNHIVPVDFDKDENIYTYEIDEYGCVMPKIHYFYDSMWEYDIEGDFINAEFYIPNDMWGLDEEENIIPLNNGEISSTWTLLNIEMTLKDEYIPDTMWSVDERDDIVPEEYSIVNDNWELDEEGNVTPTEYYGDIHDTWDFNNHNLVPKEEYSLDAMWGTDDDYMPEEDGLVTEDWEYDEEGNIIPTIGGEYTSSWILDVDEIYPTEYYELDGAWDIDEMYDFMPAVDIVETDIWELDIYNNLVPV